MTKVISSFELSLRGRSRGQSLANWLYVELHSAILDGRLKAGAQLPASREFARLYRVSRGTVVNAFERLQDEGFLHSRVGVGTRVNTTVHLSQPARGENLEPPRYIRQAISSHPKPKPFVNWVAFDEIRPFRMRDPALAEFPAELWARIAARRRRTFLSWLQEGDDGYGYRPLREAIAHYAGSSRGVKCDADQIFVTSGVQQSLDLLARFLLKAGDRVWIEDPGYFGAAIAFARVGAKMVPVPVDKDGLVVASGLKSFAYARGAFVTPAHQYPLGMTMSLGRRMELLTWAHRTGAFIIEDDYDSEYRFEGLPVPALQALDTHSSVIYVGTFTKLLFPQLRTGYVVLPRSAMEAFMSFKRGTDFHSCNMDQAVLCDFIVEGHFARHLRRMRDLYASRLDALMDYGRKYLTGLLEISETRAGLYTAAFLKNGMRSREAEAVAARHDLETRALDRFCLKCPDPQGLLLGFAAFDEKAIRAGAVRLATALDRSNFRVRS